MSGTFDHQTRVIYKPPLSYKVFGRTTTHFPRGYLDAKVGLTLDVLDLVDPWLQFSVFENRGTVTGRVESYGWQSTFGKSWGAQVIHDTSIIRRQACLPRFRPADVRHNSHHSHCAKTYRVEEA